ncbi:MAG: tyrosyl-tRNA synthetase [Myxococcaceae bacterium]|nr:tyrosyl-tRNA synthetase [Myxococcaceae bacterium]
MSFLDEITWRGLLHQATAQQELRAHLETPGRVAYAGFDPTADSLTVGHLIPIMLLQHFQRAGHRPVVLIGGGTGLIGDPSGKDSERTLQTRERVDQNVAGQRKVLERFLDFSTERANGALLVNNADWLEKLGYLEVLRTIGKHFSVNAMIQRDSVRTRLESREQGISYTEFSYMLLQAYDFLHLHRTLGVTLQMAGSDQFGNIASGVDLIRRDAQGAGHEAFGLTAPLLLRADGKKFGKSEKGAVWLSADKTSPYAFYQFWINVDDADVGSYLKLFTFLSQDEIASLLAAHAQEPHKREAQRTLARTLTALVHGEAELKAAEIASSALFTGDLKGLSESLLDAVMEDVPSSEHPRSALEAEGIALLELLPETKLVSSKREARQFLETGAVLVNGDKAAPTQRLTSSDLLHGKVIVLKRGKKNWHLTRWV